MSIGPLETLYQENNGKVSDKWALYLAEYERVLNQFSSKPIRLLEIGVQNGGSLEIWSKYFPYAQKLVGCDINPDCARLHYKDPRIAVIIGDANLDAVQAEILQGSSAFDIIIDDGSHRSSDIVKSFCRYFPYLTDGGVYVVEDLHCSYWQEYEGGLFAPFSAMTFFRRLTDVVNHENWGIEKDCDEIFRDFFLQIQLDIDAKVLRHVHSIEFVNSMCLIHKAEPERNRLGPRIIRGSLEMVVPGLHNLNGELIQVPDQTRNNWSELVLPPEEELLLHLNGMAEHDSNVALLCRKVSERRSQIVSLNEAVSQRESQIAELIGSYSWRLTAPLRFINRQYKKLKRALFGKA